MTGIYIGDGKVIHNMGKNGSGKKKACKSRPQCGYDGRGGLVETCVECFRATSGFLTGTKLYLFLYGVPKLECEIRLRAYCSPKQSKPADEVVAKAKEMLESKKQGGTRYGFFFNNCEDFATLCKTGTAFCTQSELLFGRVGYPILKQLVQSS